MIEVKKIQTKNDIKKFVKFGTTLYKNCPYFVPPIFVDEVNMFIPSKNACFLDTDVQCFLAYKDGQIVGKIAGLIQKTYNEIKNEKKVRFSRFDCVDDQEVANALFDAVVQWAKEKGMTKIHGPLGFNDMDREALLVDGFEEMSTFEEQYNYPYYQTLIENYGMTKDVGYVEYRITVPEKMDERYDRVSNLILKKYNLHVVETNNKNKFIDRWAQEIFDLLDEAYKDLYGVVPYGKEVRQQFIKSFKLVINMKYGCLIVNEANKVVGFGLAFPSLSKAVHDCKGKLLPTGIFKLIKSIKNPKELDLALIAVSKEYRNKGVPSLMFTKILSNMIKYGVKYVETNLNMESNEEIQAQWKPFEHRLHKKRRCYIKEI